MGGMCDQSARNVLVAIIKEEYNNRCESSKTLWGWIDILVNCLTSDDIDAILGYSYQDSPHYNR